MAVFTFINPHTSVCALPFHTRPMSVKRISEDQDEDGCRRIRIDRRMTKKELLTSYHDGHEVIRRMGPMAGESSP